MFYAEIKSCDNVYIFDYKNSTNKKNDEKFDITIVSKVELGNCKINKDNGDKIDYPFYISFDIDTLNYHIVPKDREKNDYMDDILESLKKKIKAGKLNNWKITYRGNQSNNEIPGSVMGGKKCAKNHKWIEVVINHISFILEFQTLCFDGDTLNCYLDKIQFVAYPRPETLNYFSLNGDLHIMYPNKGNGNYCVGNNRVVYNTEFNWESDSKDIVKKFTNFINEIIEKSNKIYEQNTKIYRSCKKCQLPKVYTHND